jgi:hypothetical protein
VRVGQAEPGRVAADPTSGEGFIGLLGLALGVGGGGPSVTRTQAAGSVARSGVELRTVVAGCPVDELSRRAGRRVLPGRPERVDERTLCEGSEPDLPGRRFLLAQRRGAAYVELHALTGGSAELVFTDVLWRDVDHRMLWRMVRRTPNGIAGYGSAIDTAAQGEHGR